MKKKEKSTYEIKLSKKEKENLEALFNRRKSHPKIRDRAQCVLMRNNGFTLEVLAQALCCSVQNIKNILTMFLASGINGIKKLRYKGDPGDLSPEDKDKLKEYLDIEHVSAAKEIRQWIEVNLFKVFTVRGVTKLLNKLGYSWKKPKQQPGNKDRCKVKITKKSVEALKAEIPMEIVLCLQNFIGEKFISKQDFFTKLESLSGKDAIDDYHRTIEGYLSVSDSSEEAQRQHVKYYNDLKKIVSSRVVVLHVDAMHLIHLPKLGSCWIKKGKDFILPTNTGRKRLNIFGAYNPDTHDVIIDIDESNCDHERVIEFFKKIEASFDSSVYAIAIILDNAKYYRTPEVRSFLETSRIMPVFTPPYCPNLNLIERFWKFCKKHLVVNSYVEKYKDFKDKVANLFVNLDKYKTELKTLITENFQILGNV